MMNLLDGVKSVEIKLTKEMKSLSRLVKDKSLSMVDRIESFEDIISLEIGDTSLNRARNLERELDIRQLYIRLMFCFRVLLLVFRDNTLNLMKFLDGHVFAEPRINII